jgi:hypothetical protein
MEMRPEKSETMVLLGQDPAGYKTFVYKKNVCKSTELF